MKICSAMKKAGIRFPTSQRGIDFCIDECPYDYCIVTETPKGRPRDYSVRALAKKALVQKLYSTGELTPTEIAIKTGISIHSVRRYLGKKP